MKKTFKKKLLATMLAGVTLPLAVSAGGSTDAELLDKIDALTRELAALKSQVKANAAKAAETEAKVQAVSLDDLNRKVDRLESKSLGKWLKVSGDYRFRYDSLHGETKTFTDVAGTFANAQNALQANFFADPSPMNAAMLSGLMNFAQGMQGVQTYDQANQFLNENQQMAGALGNFAATVPAYKPKNSSLMTNRFTLDLQAQATQDVSVSARFLMYKVFGAQDEAAITNAGSAPFAADRVGVFDGTLGHIPSNSYLDVDRVYATWSNILEQDMWFSVGRRPSTNGIPSHLRLNDQVAGRGGIPSLLVNYAFDGMTFGYAPYIEPLPGFAAKICFGRGFDSGYVNGPVGNSLDDTDMLGVAVTIIDTTPLRVWMQWNRGMNIFDAPVMNDTYFGDTMPKTNLGDIDWYGAGVLSTLKNVGPGNIHLFADFAYSKTDPNDNVSAQFGFQGLLTGSFFQPEAPNGKEGNAISVGLRYDLPSRTKIGFEYNHGSKNWITFAPAADDLWTAKAGTRGNVYEAYIIQELDKDAVSSYFSSAYFQIGFQYYDFQYTGSNNWVGAPVKISDINGQMMATTPLEKATNIYANFEVKF